MIVARYVPMAFEGGASSYWMITVFGPVLCCLLLLIWWLAASRATWKERVFGLAGLIGSLAVVLAVADPTMRGPGTSYLTLPMGMLAFGVGVVLLRRRQPLVRTCIGLLLAVAGFSFTLLLRSEGMTGDYGFTLRWRWAPTFEEQMLMARASEGSTTAVPTPRSRLELALANPDWPGFRGADRSGGTTSPSIVTNWSSEPPEQLWKIPMGPGWSSFAVAGNYLYTQEQRGPMETVVCLDGDSGREVWSHSFEARLEDPMGGPGPRATPTLADGGLFVTGATGLFFRLDPATGKVIWQKDLKEIAQCDTPMWGFSASPVVAGGNVIVFTGAKDDKSLLAFAVDSGELRWSATAGTESYASPQLNRIAGEELVSMLTNDGLVLVDPASGTTRLSYAWKGTGYRALQARVLGDDTILLPTGVNLGTRAIRVKKAGDELVAEELWTSRNLKPDFSDLVTFQGHAYGNDGGILTCLDLSTGERMWKGGRYGKGQLILLEKSGLLLVAAESGQVVLVRADPKEFVEVDSFRALEGKTWNHPVVVGDRLYVRNAQEAAGFRLQLVKATGPSEKM